MGITVAGVFKFLGAVLFGAGAEAGAGYILAVNLARVGLLALTAKLTAPKLDLTEAATIKSLTIRDTIAPQSFVYGEDMLSGPIIFSNVCCAGNENRNLYTLIALTGHEIDSVTKYRIDDVDIPLTDLAGAEDGEVTGGKFDTVARVDLRKGTSTQTVIGTLSSTFPGLFGTSHTGRGWAYMLWVFKLIEGKEDVFKTQPRNIRAVVKGKAIYDPRLDTGGAGDDPTNASFITWSDNPALCLADFIRWEKFGMNEEDDRLDWDMVVTAADVCDELVAIPTASTQKRYTCNAVFRSDMVRSQVRDEILGSMMGRMVFSQGLWKIWAGEAVVADVTLTEANLLGAIQLEASTSSRDRYNRVRGKFVDSERDYTAAAYPEQRSSTFVTEDGGEVREIVADFTSTNTGFEAQRKAIITLKQSRNQRIVVFQGNYSCFRIQPGATVDLTIDEFGFAGEKFFVSEWKLSSTGIDLTLVEEVDSVWADPLEGDYTVRTETGTLVFGETGIPAPTSLTATAIFEGVQLNWTNPLLGTFRYIEIHASDDNVRGNAVIIAEVTSTPFVEVLHENPRERFYWIRAVNAQGEVSDFEPDLTTTTANAIPRTSATNILIDPDFDKSTGFPGPFWGKNTKDGGVVTFVSAGGANSSNAIDMEWGADAPDAVADLNSLTRHRLNHGQLTFHIRYQTFGTVDSLDHPILVGARRYIAETGGTAANIFSGPYTLPRSVGSWASAVMTLNVPDNPTYQYFAFMIQGWPTGESADTMRIDSIFIYPGEEVFGTQVFDSDVQSGLVPLATSGESTKVLQGDGTWVANAGGAATSLSTGTRTATTYGITSDGSADDVILLEATTSLAGLLGAAKWDEIVANTAKVTNATHTGQVTGDTALLLAIAAITDQPASGAIVAADTILINDGGVLSESTFTQLDTYFNSSLAFNNYVHPNHSGDVTSVGDGAQTIHPTAISGKALVTAIANDMVLLWDDTDSLLKRADAGDFLGLDTDKLTFSGSTALIAVSISQIESRGSIVGSSPPVDTDNGGNTFVFTNSDDTVVWGSFDFGSGAFGGITNNVRGQNVRWRAERAAGGLATVFSADPDGGVTLAFTGGTRLATLDNGIRVSRAGTGAGVYIEEDTAVPTAPSAGDGVIWVKDDVPNTLWFTDDGGTDHQLGVGGGVSDVTGGVGIDSSGGATPDISLNLSELAVSTMVAGDWIAFDNAGVSNKALISAIPLGIFNNDQGWTSNVGTVTSIGITPGALIDVTGSPVTTSGNITVDVDLSELTDLTTAMVATDELVILDASVQKRKSLNEIDLGLFNNDQNWNNYVHPNHSGDVTSVGDGAQTIVADAVTYAKMQNVVADDRILGNIAGAGGIVAELTAAQVRTMINVEDGSTADQTSIVGITGTTAQFDTAVTGGNFAFAGGAYHDGFSDFLANEHIDWTAAGAGTIHTDNYIENATHTGEVTGSGVLTIDPTAISGKTLVTAIATDMILLWDATDSALKRADINDLLGTVTDRLVFSGNDAAVVVAAGQLELRGSITGSNPPVDTDNGTNNIVFTNDDDTVVWGSLEMGSSAINRLRSNVRGTIFEIEATSAAGSIRNQMVCDADAGVSLMYTGGERFTTVDHGIRVSRVGTGAGVFIEEDTAVPVAPAAGDGVIWVKDDVPNTLWFTNDAGGDFQLGIGVAEINDLTVAVTWANVPNANITAGSVTQHEAALTILESQITNGTILARLAAAETIAGVWTHSAILITDASDTAAAGLRLPHGADPTSPVNGDLWTTTGSAFVRINGVTQDLLAGGGIGSLVEDTSPQLGGNLASNAFDIIMADNDQVILGTGSDAKIYFSGVDFFIDMVDGADFRLRGGVALDLMITAIDDGAVNLYYEGTQEIATQLHTTSGNTSGGQVKDHTGTLRDIGFNDWRVMSEDVADTLEAKHAGGVYFKDNTGTIILTLAASGDVDFPVHAVCQIINASTSGGITVTEGASTTLFMLTGASRIDTAGGCSVLPGGYATLWRESTTIYYIMGAGILP